MYIIIIYIIYYIYSITQLIITYIEFCHTCWRPILLGLRGCNKVVCGDDLERLTDMVPRLPKIPNFHTSGIKGLKRYTGNDRMTGKVTGLVVSWILSLNYVVWFHSPIMFQIVKFKTGWHPQDAQPHTRTHDFPATLWRYQDLGRENWSFAYRKVCLSRRH